MLFVVGCLLLVVWSVVSLVMVVVSCGLRVACSFDGVGCLLLVVRCLFLSFVVV